MVGVSRVDIVTRTAATSVQHETLITIEIMSTLDTLLYRVTWVLENIRD